MAKDNDISWPIVLQHMQGMEQRLGERIDGVEQNLGRRIDRLESTVDHNHVQTMASLDTIDERLDDVGVIQVPRLKKAVGMK